MMKSPASMVEVPRRNAHRSRVGWLCPACGADANRLTGPDATTLVDEEGFRWHRSCVVEMLPAVRKLLKQFNFDVGRTDR